MSYLSPLRLHFSGQFQANISTVNNDPGHYNNSAFQPSYQQLEGIGMQPPNGWFNPQGDAAWRFLGCRVTTAWMSSGKVSGTDSVLSCIIADSDSRAPAKLVDLDPEQQLVSEIWGLQVRIADTNGNTLMRGDFKPAAFIDIWDRATGSPGGDIVASAMYQSVLQVVEWNDISGSPFLEELKKHADENGSLLSIKFNVDSFNMDYTQPGFMTGRIVGTIGPASATEPKHMVFGRHFMAGETVPGANFYLPPGQINFCSAVVDETGGKVYLDLGNALPTGTGSSMVDLGDLTLGVFDPLMMPWSGSPSGSILPIGTIPSSQYAADPNWYANTAGVVVLPISPELLPMVQRSPLVLSGNPGVFITEWSSGAYVRADTFVYRMNPGDSVSISVYAMQYGKAVPERTAISFAMDSSQLQTQPGSGFPFVNTNVLTFQPGLVGVAFTDSTGCARLLVTAGDPGTPRYFNISETNPTGDYGIDGQLYGLRAGFVDTQTYGSQPVNQWDFISFLVWSGFSPKVPGNPTWFDDLQPIFQQYANLYPVMNRFLNLADYNSVKENHHLLTLAFGLDVSNPNSMPVTRDLSPPKRKAILQWLQNGMPPGTQPVAPVALAATQRLTQGPPTPPASRAPAFVKRGGKAMAAARRLVVQTRQEGSR